MDAKRRTELYVALSGLALLAILLATFFYWWAGIILVALFLITGRYLAIREYKRIRDTANINTEYGQIIIKACNQKIDELNFMLLPNRTNIFKRLRKGFKEVDLKHSARNKEADKVESKMSKSTRRIINETRKKNG